MTPFPIGLGRQPLHVLVSESILGTNTNVFHRGTLIHKTLYAYLYLKTGSRELEGGSLWSDELAMPVSQVGAAVRYSTV